MNCQICLTLVHQADTQNVIATLVEVQLIDYVRRVDPKQHIGVQRRITSDQVKTPSVVTLEFLLLETRVVNVAIVWLLCARVYYLQFARFVLHSPLKALPTPAPKWVYLLDIDVQQILRRLSSLLD